MPKVSILVNGKKETGHVDMDNAQDGVYKVFLDNNTLYFAVFSELEFTTVRKILTFNSSGFAFTVEMSKSECFSAWVEMKHLVGKAEKQRNSNDPLPRKSIKAGLESVGFKIGRYGNANTLASIAAGLMKQLDDYYYSSIWSA